MKDKEWKIKKPMLFAEKYGILIFPLTAGILFLLQNTSHTIAGSQIDWISQHTVLAEYFRQRFYSTHEFFPQFASELGGGQNIYNFAYYGLYSPLVLLSYAFPFLSMEVWFQIMGILTHTADGVLCFFWLNRHLKKPYSICGAMVLMCSSAVVYHTYAQVMFVDYLPFLLLMLIGVDTCRKTKGKVLLIIGAMGTVLTSFYFAPAAFTAVGIYVLCGTKIESTGKGTGRLKSVLLFLKDCLWQLFPVFYGIVLSAFYLCPVLCTLAGGRSGGKDIQATDLFVPDVTVGKYLYKPYGLGMTAIAVMAVCMWIIRGRKIGKERWKLALLLAVIFLLPVFPWLLNGGLYARSKAFLPFLPLVCFLTASFLETLSDQNQIFSGKQLLTCFAAAGAVLLYGAVGSSGEEQLLLVLDLVMIGVGLLFTGTGLSSLFMSRGRQVKSKWLDRPDGLTAILTLMMVLAVSIGTAVLSRDTHTERALIQELHDPGVRIAAETILSEESYAVRMEVRGDREYEKANQNRILTAGQNLTTCYSSVENPWYTRFRQAIGLEKSTRNRLMLDAQRNPLFLRFMGVKYLIGGDCPEGWTEVSLSGEAENQKEKVSAGGQPRVYRQEKAAPLFYLTDQTMGEKAFQNLTWQEKQIDLLEYAIVPEQKESSREKAGMENVRKDAEDSLSECGVTFAGTESSDKTVSYTEAGKLRIRLKKAAAGKIFMERETQKGEYLFLSFQVKNNQSGKDVSVTVNGTKNKLSSIHTDYATGDDTFHYVFALPEGTRELSVIYGSGDYELEDISCLTGSVDEDRNRSLYQNPVQLTQSSSGNGYEGLVQADDSGWLVTSLPYDENFHITVDGKEIQPERLNTAFLGIHIQEGKHQVKIWYESAGSQAGLLLSGVAVVVGGIGIFLRILLRTTGQRRKARQELIRKK
ncbi:MAG: YfhO family protein [[Ruminococcus] lactaris]